MSSESKINEASQFDAKERMTGNGINTNGNFDNDELFEEWDGVYRTTQEQELRRRHERRESVDKYEGVPTDSQIEELVRDVEQCEEDGFNTPPRKRTRVQVEPEGENHLGRGRSGERTPPRGRLDNGPELQLGGITRSAFKEWRKDASPANGIPDQQGHQLARGTEDDPIVIPDSPVGATCGAMPRRIIRPTRILSEGSEQRARAVFRAGGSGGVRAGTPRPSGKTLGLGNYPEGNPRRYGYRRPEDEVLRKLRVARRILDEICGMVQRPAVEENARD